MMSSTAAKSAARLCCAITEKSSLQLLCLQTIRDNPQLEEQFNSIPGLKRTFEGRYFWVMSKEIDGRLVFESDYWRYSVAIVGSISKVTKRTTPLETRFREKRPLLDEARADPDHVSYREIFGRKIKIRKTVKKSGACHHSIAVNPDFGFVYRSDPENEEESDEDDEYEHYCVSCNTRLTDPSETPLCLPCVLGLQ